MTTSSPNSRRAGTASLGRRIATGVLAVAILASCATPTDRSGRVVTIDVDRFYALYDAAHGRPTADVLQRDYLDAGTPGLRQFAAIRDLSGATLAAAIAKNPAPFENARRCTALLPAVRTRVAATLRHLVAIDPQATFPPITVLIGRATTGGTTSKSGVLVGLETLCAADWIEPDAEDRFVHLIAHEYAHVQQAHADETDAPGATLLFASLIEGGAEFVAERTSGAVAYTALARETAGREGVIETEFRADGDGTDLSRWLYNGRGDAKRPGDLGYRVGYRIVRSYYDHATDKGRAIQDILGVSQATARTFLAASGWSPGIVLPPIAR